MVRFRHGGRHAGKDLSTAYAGALSRCSAECKGKSRCQLRQRTGRITGVAMPSILAIALVLTFMAAVVVLVVMATKGGRSARPALIAAASFILFVVFLQTGIAGGGRLPAAGISVPPIAHNAEQCAQIRKVLKDAGLSVDRSDPERPRIAGPLAERIPEEVQEAVAACFAGQPAG